MTTHDGDPRSIWRLAARVSLTVAMLTPCVAFVALFPASSRMPTWDQWSLVPAFDAIDRGLPFVGLLLEPYNGQHQPVARGMMVAVGMLTRWDQRVEIAMSFAFAAGTLALFVAMLRRSDPRLLVLAAPVAAIVFSPHQLESFVSAYPVGQQLQQLLVTAVLYLVSRAELDGRTALWSALLAAAATLSWAAGLAAWGIGLLALLARRRDRPGWIAAWAVATAAMYYLVRSAGSGFGPMAIADAPRFFVVLLGATVSPVAFPSVRAATVFGLVFLIVVLVLAALAAGRLASELLPWALSAAGGLGAAAMIAAGRASSGLPQALVSHYATAVYPVAVGALAILCSLLLRRADSSPAGRAPARLQAMATLAAVALVSLAVVLVHVRVAKRVVFTAREWAAISSVSRVRLVEGTITDEEIRRSFHPDVELVRREAITLRRMGFGGFPAAR